MKVDERILLAESLRESGKVGEALGCLSRLIGEFLKEGDAVNLAAAFGQRIVCYKHLAQNEQGKRRNWLCRMGTDIASGLMLNVSDVVKAPFWLRKGDLAFMYDNAPMAIECYERAVEMVAGTRQHGEYLGHLAEALLMVNRHAEADGAIMQAVLLHKAARKNYTGELWRYCIVRSGLCARQTRIYLAQRRWIRAGVFLVYGYVLALWLRYYHRMPQRLNQFHVALRGYFQKFTGPSAQV